MNSQLSREALEWLWTRKSRTSPAGALLRAPLSALALSYSSIMRARAAAYARGYLKSRRVPAKVLAVGNLTLGGAGKTPLVAELAGWLHAQGYKVVVLSRGYKRRSSAPALIVSLGAGPLYPAMQTGDEPAWLAERLSGVPVIVARDRYQGAELALERFRATYLVLDDAYQHLSLARDVNVLVADGRYELNDEWVFPRGRLRESLSAARRADLVVLSKVESLNAIHDQWLAKYNPQAPVFAMRYRPRGILSLDRQQIQGVHPPAVAFCGLGEPDYFFRLLEEYGVKLLARVSYPDHHYYSVRDLAELEERSRRLGAERLITTEKDAVKLRDVPWSGMPVHVLRVEIDWFDKRAEFFEELYRLLGGKDNAA